MRVIDEERDRKGRLLRVLGTFSSEYYLGGGICSERVVKC